MAVSRNRTFQNAHKSFSHLFLSLICSFKLGLGELYAAVEELGYTVPPTYLSGWVDQVAEMPLVKFRMYLEQNGVDIDVFLAETPFQQELMQRRKLQETEEGSVWFVSPEDLVLLKLVANRVRDTADVLDVLFTQGAAR